MSSYGCSFLIISYIKIVYINSYVPCKQRSEVNDRRIEIETKQHIYAFCTFI